MRRRAVRRRRAEVLEEPSKQSQYVLGVSTRPHAYTALQRGTAVSAKPTAAHITSVHAAHAQKETEEMLHLLTLTEVMTRCLMCTERCCLRHIICDAPSCH